MTKMMGALRLIVGTVPGWEPVQLRGAQRLAAFGPRACGIQGGKVAAGCCAWDPLGARRETGLGPATGIGPRFATGRETSRGETPLQGQAEERQEEKSW